LLEFKPVCVVLIYHLAAGVRPLLSQTVMRAGFIRIAAGAVKGSPLKHGFLTGQGWTYDDMAEQTGGDSICGMCRHDALLVLSPP